MTTQTATPKKAPKTVVDVRWSEFEELCNKRGWVNDYQRSQAIGIEHTTIRRIRHGGHAGGRFIACTLEALEVPFEAVFIRRAA